MDKTRRRVEYVWLDGKPNFPQMRSKARYINMDDTYHGLPDWNFDGGSTLQGNLENSDRCLRPVRAYKDPFNEDGLLVMCEVFYHNGVPHESNLRTTLSTLVEKNPDAGYLVGMEQEFTFLNPANLEPLGLLLSPRAQGQYYCGVGCMNVIGRFIVEDFEKKCWEAGLELDGVNAEVMPGQWEWQTAAQGPLKTADDLWMSRYILERVAEAHAAIVSYDPKPHPDMNGAGCHTNISTQKMRESFGVDEQEEVMTHLGIDHVEHVKVCGEGLESRMTGDCETSDYKVFSWGVGDRGASIRIPEQVNKEGAGYFEDRRPCANIDPYQVLYSLISTVNKSKVL
jgi:glutamine synthetase